MLKVCPATTLDFWLIGGFATGQECNLPLLTTFVWNSLIKVCKLDYLQKN